jgi:phage replication O-like protein O
VAKPQLEDGHTKIANEILEHLVKMHLTPNQWQVLLCILRKTYGFHKKVDRIANSQIVEATGLCKAVVSRALKSLEDMKVIIRNGKFIGLQKDWELWEKLAVVQTIEAKDPPNRRIIRADGYAAIWIGAVEPEFKSMVTRQGYVLEHRLIMARKLKRVLEPWEVVHHIDGVRDNNKEENLMLLPGKPEHLPSIMAQKRIKELEEQLAALQTSDDVAKLATGSLKLAISSPTLAGLQTKVSSPAVTQKKKETITKETIQKKERYGEFQNVRLSKTECDKLVERFGKDIADRWIEKLSTWKKSNGKEKKDDYATILNWARRDEERIAPARSFGQDKSRGGYSEPPEFEE